MADASGHSIVAPEEWAEVDEADAHGFADRSIALVGPHGRTGARAISAGLARSTAVGLFESRVVFNEARALGFQADLVVAFAVDGPQIEVLNGSPGTPPRPGVTFFSSGEIGRASCRERV